MTERVFDIFRTKYVKEDVKELPNNVPDSPLVTIIVLAYNQVDYIRECLEGLLMQETSFKYEIVIGEDDSNDGTREICIDYAGRYSDRVRLLMHSRENNIMVCDSPTGNFNFLYNLFNSNGQYIAMCEGDDAWTDPHKLEKQVSLLESDANLSMVFTACSINKIDGSKKIKSYGELGLIDLNAHLTESYFIATASIVVKKEIFRHFNMEWTWNSFALDFLIRYFALIDGYVGYIDEVTCTYNKFTPGSWSMRKLTQKRILKEYSDMLRAYYYLDSQSRLEEKTLKKRVRLERESVYLKAAQMRGGLYGLFYLIINIRNCPPHYLMSYLKSISKMIIQ